MHVKSVNLTSKSRTHADRLYIRNSITLPPTIRIRQSVDRKYCGQFAVTGGGGERYRTTDAERMAMYLEMNYAKENDEQTQDEKLAGISLEGDIRDIYYVPGGAL